MTKEIERRSVPGTVELRAAAGSAKRAGGYAIVWDKRSQNLGGFVEVVRRGFVAKSVADKVDVLARYQHDSDRLLGRVASGTLRLAEDDTGLDYDVDLPDTTYARDMAALIERGDVRGSSFAFRTMPDGDRWDFTESGFPLRELLPGGGALVDVAPVVTPAYLDATSGLRSLAEQRSLDLAVVKAAAAHNQLGDLMRSADPTVIDLGSSGSAGTTGEGQRATHPDAPAPTVKLDDARARLALRERRARLS